MSEQDRKARLAALRKKRHSKDNEISSASQDAKRHKPEQHEESSHIEEPSIKLEQEEKSAETALTAPTLILPNTDIVEAVAPDIQDGVLRKAETAASEGLLTSAVNTRQKHIYTADLLEELAPYLRRAKTKTDRAIFGIVQKKYEESKLI